MAFRGVGKGISLTNQQLRSAVSALRKDGHLSPKTADLLEDTLDDAEMIAEMPDGVTDMAEHTARVEEATADVMVGKAPELDIEANPLARMLKTLSSLTLTLRHSSNRLMTLVMMRSSRWTLTGLRTL